ncbi:tryptophan-rich sensory protein [Roseivirga sp.]|uniref:tryptophan-rich sensory protein n=1 Tax=Roseivirga sp. TaxID=1964215 RepID=UPI003B52A858
MNNRSFAWFNAIVVATTIFLSYYSNTGAINGNTMGSLSNEYTNLFTPAGYAFAIWGFIYIGLIGNAVFQLFNSKDPMVRPMATWLSLANIANCIWVLLWLYELTRLSILAMILILFSLLKLTVALQIGFRKQSVWAWWPVSIYTGWITVALAANISAYLAKINWVSLLSESNWAITIILVASAIYIFLILKRRLAYAGYVGVWALAAIAVKQWGEQITIQWVAVISCALLFVLSVYQDYVNRTKLSA